MPFHHLYRAPSKSVQAILSRRLCSYRAGGWDTALLAAAGTVVFAPVAAIPLAKRSSKRHRKKGAVLAAMCAEFNAEFSGQRRG